MTGGFPRLLASCLGVGRLRPAPGTWGSAFALVLYVPLLSGLPLAARLAAIAVATVVGVWAADRTAAALASDDPSEVVIDELAGMWIAALGAREWPTLVAAFLLFRALDIWKPFPARRLESLHGGLGIMLDDLVAGAYALACVLLAQRAGLLP